MSEPDYGDSRNLPTKAMDPDYWGDGPCYCGIDVKGLLAKSRADVIAEVVAFLENRRDPDGYFFWGPQFADIVRREFGGES